MKRAGATRIARSLVLVCVLVAVAALPAVATADLAPGKSDKAQSLAVSPAYKTDRTLFVGGYYFMWKSTNGGSSFSVALRRAQGYRGHRHLPGIRSRQDAVRCLERQHLRGRRRHLPVREQRRDVAEAHEWPADRRDSVQAAHLAGVRGGQDASRDGEHRPVQVHQCRRQLDQDHAARRHLSDGAQQLQHLAGVRLGRLCRRRPGLQRHDRLLRQSRRVLDPVGAQRVVGHGLR